VKGTRVLLDVAPRDTDGLPFPAMEADRWSVLDDHLPRPIRLDLEERLWRPIEAQATLEVLLDDPTFVADPGHHPAIFADHGVVHVRDVAAGLVRLVDTIDGVLLPARPASRRRFVETVGVALAYLHDIGMVDMSVVGRRTHPQFAAHASFGSEVDGLVDHLVGSGRVRDRLESIAAAAPFAVPLDLVVREILSLSVAHSKSTIPAPVLDDRAALRRNLQRVVFTPMEVHRANAGRPMADGETPIAFEANTDRYEDPARSFAWLDAAGGAHADLADDVIDAVRALRAADVLRQRGTVLRTSGGFELCMDSRTAQAVCTLRPATGDAVYVITYDDDRGAGEANIRVAFVTPQGHLRIAFHRGSFANDVAAERAARSVADVVDDIAADVIPSFGGGTAAGGLPQPTRAIDDVEIQLERPDDYPDFAEAVATLVAERAPSLARRLVVVAGVEGAAPDEGRRYHGGEPVDPLGPDADEVLRGMGSCGVDIEDLDRVPAFSEVRRATITAGETLVARGSPPAFVYVPTTSGLVVRPDGGYAPRPLHPWIPVGTTGVIRRAERNAAIEAEHDVDVIIIPGELYARAWLHPLRPEELAARLRAPVTTS
jgi:hypothetical protein